MESPLAWASVPERPLKAASREPFWEGHPTISAKLLPMKPLLIALAALIVAVGVPASSTAGPLTSADVAYSHSRAVAGHWFTGLTISASPLDQASITSVDCGVVLRGKYIYARLKKFYAQGVSGPVAITCSWKIPRGAHGWLNTWIGDSVSMSYGGETFIGGSWKIKAG